MPSQDRGTRETFALAEVLHQEPIKATGGPLGYPGICLTCFSLRGPRPSLVQENLIYSKPFLLGVWPGSFSKLVAPPPGRGLARQSVSLALGRSLSPKREKAF